MAMDPNENIEVYENDIELYFAEYCEKYNIDDMANATQNQFNGCMSYIGKYVFRGTDKLKTQSKQYNKYDVNKLMYVLNIYIDLCMSYSKEISINGYSKLTSIDYDTIQRWKELSCDTFVIYKKLVQENENSNSDLLTSGRNPVGIMARLNHLHGWSANIAKQETQAKQEALTLDALPQLQQIESNIMQNNSENIQDVQ